MDIPVHPFGDSHTLILLNCVSRSQNCMLFFFHRNSIYSLIPYIYLKQKKQGLGRFPVINPSIFGEKIGLIFPVCAVSAQEYTHQQCCCLSSFPRHQTRRGLIMVTPCSDTRSLHEMYLDQNWYELMVLTFLTSWIRFGNLQCFSSSFGRKKGGFVVVSVVSFVHWLSFVHRAHWINGGHGWPWIRPGPRHSHRPSLAAFQRLGRWGDHKTTWKIPLKQHQKVEACWSIAVYFVSFLDVFMS